MANKTEALKTFATELYIRTGKTEFALSEMKRVKANYGVSVPGEVWSCRASELRGAKISLKRFSEVHKLEIDFDSIETRVQAPVQPAQVAPITPAPVISETKIEKQESVLSLYIPEKSGTFVETSNYKMIRKVVNSSQFFPIYIFGISGIGKTTQIEQVCAELGRPYFRCQISPETVEEDLIGSFKLINGNLIWQDGPVIMAMRSGSILVLDEFDTNSHLMILQGILENKPFLIKQTGELVHPKQGFNIFATGNTDGSGNDGIEYVGTTVLNEAQRDRFAFYIRQELPSVAIEKKIAKKFIAQNNIDMPEKDYETLFRFIKQVREAYEKAEMVEYISTRRIQFILKAYGIFGNLDTAIDYVLKRFSEESAMAFKMIYESLKEEVAVSENSENTEVTEEAPETETAETE